MRVQQSNYNVLHHRTQTLFPDLSGDTLVFVARRGTHVVGTAYVTHRQNYQDVWYHERQLECTVQSDNEAARFELIQAAREATRPLKRRFVIN
jgi:hypothetical protein